MKSEGLPLHSPADSPHVLLAAYQCGPGMGSVSQIGWEWYSRLAARTPVTLVTHARNRPAIEQAGGACFGSDLIYIDTEWFAGPLYRLAARLFPRSPHAIFLLASFDFFVYDREAERILRTRMARGAQWDVVHAVTPVSPVAATRLHRLGVPLLVGPWNGGLGVPPAFVEIMQQDSSWLYPLRQFGRVMDWAVGTTRNARIIFTATRTTRNALPANCHTRCATMLENGVNLEVFSPAPWPAAPSATQPLRVVFVGRLAPFKGLPLLFKAIAQVRREFPVQLAILGDGPMAKAWRREAVALDLGDDVTFHGACSAAEVAAHLQRSHVMCLPSVRESGGAVLLEAMACARPVIAVAFGGPAEVIDDGVGYTVPPISSSAVTEDIAYVLGDIVRNPIAWRRRGEEGRRRAEQRYSWPMKIEQALVWYRQLLTKPSAPTPADFVAQDPHWGEA